jgi:tRNA(fMet)-specific endonuclease VapC
MTRKRAKPDLEEFLAGVNVIGVSEQISKRFGHLRGTLRQLGQRIPDFDLLIAATAIEHNLTLLSNNRRHFERISGLRIESL